MTKKRDPDILGGHARGAIRRNPVRAISELSEAQWQELKDARSGVIPWVSPGVAAYVMEISPDLLKKRRQGVAPGVVPEHKKQGNSYLYKWTSIQAQSADVDDLKKVQKGLIEQIALLREQQVQEQQASKRRDGLFGQLLDRLGINVDALNVMTLWTTDDQGRLTGHAALADATTWSRTMEGQQSVALTWMDALRQPWRHEEDREPYHRAVLVVLDQARVEAMTPAAG